MRFENNKITEEKYQVLVDFVNIEKQKPEYLCKEVQDFLEDLIDNGEYNSSVKEWILDGHITLTYGKENINFLEVSMFDSFNMKDGLPILKKINLIMLV